MKILDNLFLKFGFIKKSLIKDIPIAEGGNYGGLGIWQSNKKVSSEQALNLNKGWVYTCVRAIAEGMSGMKFKLYRIKNNEDKEEVKDHPLLDLLNYVNDFTSCEELKYLTSSYLELCGNAYWLLDRDKDGQEPRAIFALNPKYLKVIKGKLPNPILGYEYKVGNEEKQKFEPWQVIHFRYPDPNDPYEGSGTLQAIMEWVDLDNWITQINTNYFKNGVRLSGTIETDQSLSPEQMEYLRRSFEAIYKGSENSYQVGVMPNGAKLKEGGSTPKEMDFPNFTDVSRDRILAGFRVPKTVLATAESSTNRATAETATYVFAALTLKPKMQHISGYLNEYLVPIYGDDLVLEFDDPVPENTQNKIEEMKAATANQPVISLNEARQKYYGLEPVENGDAVMTDFSKTPVGVVKPKPKAMNEGREKHQTKQQLKKSFAKNVRSKKDIVESVAGKALEVFKNMLPVKKSITEMTDEEYAPVHKAFVGRVTPFEKAQKEVVQKFNAKQKKEVLKNLSKIVKGFKKEKAMTLFDKEEDTKILIDLSTPIHEELYGKEAIEAAKLIGMTETDFLTPEVRRAIQAAMELMSETYNETTIELLTSKLEEGIAAGESIDGLTNLVEQVYEFSDQVRAETVARTESFRTANEATRDTWEQSGVVKTLKWYTAADEIVCDQCGPMNGTVVDVDEPFDINSDYGDGYNPQDIHPNCRCYIRPDEISADDGKSVKKEEEKELSDEEADSLIEKLFNHE